MAVTKHIAKERRDYYAVNWDLRPWLKGRAQILTLAKQWGVSDATVHMWMQKHRVPLSVHKALIQKYAPQEAAAFRRQLTATKAVHPSFTYRTNAFTTLVSEYDRANAGERFATADGGWIYCVASANAEPGPVQAEAAPVPAERPPEPAAAPPPAEPEHRVMDVQVPSPLGLINMQFPQVDALKQTEHVLLDLLLLLRHENQQLSYSKLEWEGKSKEQEQQLVTLRERVQGLEAELREWQGLAMSGGKSGPSLSPTNAAAIEETRKVLTKQAPSLVSLLDRLPKATAH